MTEYYFKAMIGSDYDDYDEVYLKSTKEVKKDDYVIFINEAEPVIAKVVLLIDELEALLKDIYFQDVYQVLDLKPYFESRKNEIKKLKLYEKMKREIELQKVEDNLRKHATDNEKIRKLYEQYVGVGKEESEEKEAQENI